MFRPPVAWRRGDVPNVQRAIREMPSPIALDNDIKMWNAY